jgi:hypothetical protein
LPPLLLVEAVVHQIADTHDAVQLVVLDNRKVTDPDSNDAAINAARIYPNRFAVIGWFHLDNPNGVATSWSAGKSGRTSSACAFISTRHPWLRLIVDHVAAAPGSRDESAYRFRPELRTLANYPNVAVDAEEVYSFHSFDAFGADRMSTEELPG